MPTSDNRHYLGRRRSRIKRALASASARPSVGRIHEQSAEDKEERARHATDTNLKLRFIREKFHSQAVPSAQQTTRGRQ